MAAASCMVFQSDWLPIQMAIFRDDLSVDPVMMRDSLEIIERFVSWPATQ
jgi:hypothetical protein